MAFSKAHKFPPETYAFSLLCKALAHPARIHVIRRILKNNNHFTQVADIGWDLPISKAALTQHLKILRDMYILDCLEETPAVYYKLNEQTPDILNGIRNLISFWEEHLELRSEELELLGSRRCSGNTPF